MLEIRNLSKAFGGKTVADALDFRVDSGRILAVLGQSGCGKSTLLKMVAGLVYPDSGEIFLNRQNLTAMPPEKRGISLMFQDYALLPHLSVLENAVFGLKMQGIPREEAARQGLAALAEVGLAHAAERKPEKLSGGEQQRLALARALITRPGLLLLDEAFSSLDTHLRQQLRRMTAERIRQQHIPAIMVTHSPEEAMTMADAIAVMHQGRILQIGTAHELLHRPANLQTARLLGLPNATARHYIPQHAVSLSAIPAADACPCMLTEKTERADTCRITFLHPEYGELTLHLDWQPDSLSASLTVGQTVYVLINRQQIVVF